MVEEITTIVKNNTWDLVTSSKGKKAIGVKWVFKTKYNADGSMQRHKVRLVAKGNSQVQGINLEEMFSLTARFETVQVFLALAMQLKWPVYQLDIKSA